MWRRIAALVIASSVLMTGCAQAKIYQRDGKVSQGRILRSDAQNLYLSNDFTGVQAVSRGEIVDVEHPGRWTMISGGALALFGLPWMMTSWVELRRDEPDYARAGGMLAAGSSQLVVGLGVLGVGAWMRYRSMKHAGQLDISRATPGVVGVPLRAEQGESRTGVGVRWTF